MKNFTTYINLVKIRKNAQQRVNSVVITQLKLNSWGDDSCHLFISFLQAKILKISI